MKFNVLYGDDDVFVVDKPAGVVVFPEGEVDVDKKTLIGRLVEKYPELKNAGKPPRYGVVHRLDKETSGIILVAKNSKALDFFQKQFKNGTVEKKYLALVVGELKSVQGSIETLIGREGRGRRKQKVYLPYEPRAKGKRKAITRYKILEKFKNYTLVEARPKTGRKHQLRCHFAYLGHPIAGDKLYGFKNQACPEGLKRQFLHANYIKIKMPDGKEKEFRSELSEDLKKVIGKLQE